MNIKEAYNIWSKQYDINLNKTRDLEAKALREFLPDIYFNNCLEVGCGTGKNTEFLLSKIKKITAVDLSEEMIAIAKTKIASKDVSFILADINKEWNFTNDLFDLVTFSLVLEHIENLDNIFREVSKKAVPGGYVYIGELHPFKQYTGSKAKFETEEGIQIVNCFNHHISDFTQSAKRFGFEITDINEFFDDSNSIPRILTLLLKKS